MYCDINTIVILLILVRSHHGTFQTSWWSSYVISPKCAIINNKIILQQIVCLLGVKLFWMYPHRNMAPNLIGEKNCWYLWHVTFRIRLFRIFRYGALWLGNIELLRTTTPEPTAAGIAWNIEKDVTIYGSYFTTPNLTAYLAIPNNIDSTYTGVIQIEATLSFYKPDLLGEYPPISLPIVLPLTNATQSRWRKFINSRNVVLSTFVYSSQQSVLSNASEFRPSPELLRAAECLQHHLFAVSLRGCVCFCPWLRGILLQQRSLRCSLRLRHLWRRGLQRGELLVDTSQTNPLPPSKSQK